MEDQRCFLVRPRAMNEVGKSDTPININIRVASWIKFLTKELDALFLPHSFTAGMKAQQAHGGGSLSGTTQEAIAS
jgi:hypothetical protein